MGVEVFQKGERGEHLIIAFASCTLLQHERNYSITDKEFLSIVFACQNFHTYLLERQV